MKSPISRKSGGRSRLGQHLDNMDAIPSRIILAGLIMLFMLSASITLLLIFYYDPQITFIQQLLSKAPSPTSTPQCVQSKLNLGAYIFPLHQLTINDDGTIDIPPGPAGTAWWVVGTENPYVIIFEPASRSLDLDSVLSPGDRVEIQWADCVREEFVLSNLHPGLPDNQSFLQQGSTGIDVIVQPVGTKDGYILHGERP